MKRTVARKEWKRQHAYKFPSKDQLFIINTFLKKRKARKRHALVPVQK